MAVWQSYFAPVHSNLHDVVVILTILIETASADIYRELKTGENVY